MLLTAANRNSLLSLARMTLQTFIKTEEMPDLKLEAPGVCQAAGALVTLWAFGQFRGRAGFLEAEAPLWQTVMELTARVATEYPGVLPVSPEELPHVRIEITVLSKIRPLQSLEEIEIGSTGLAVRGDPPAMILPEAAAAKGWTPEQFLEAICSHAGCSADAWPEKVEVLAFTADTFGEGE